MKYTITLFAIFLTTLANANVWRVNNNPNYIQDCDHCFSDLQVALDDSNVIPGDTIHIEASTVDYGDISIPKEIVLIGVGYFLPDNPGEQATQLVSSVRSISFLSNSGGSTITGLSNDVNASSTYAIHFQEGADNITITRNYILPGIDLGSINISNLTISNNYIVNSVQNNASGSNTSVLSNINVSNNYIGGNLGLHNNAIGLVTHNVLAGVINIQGGIGEFYNNICINPAFSLTQNDNTVNNVHHNIFVGEEPDWLSGGDNHFNVNLTSIFSVTGSEEDLITTLTFCVECQTGYVAGGEDNELMGIFGSINPYRRGGIPAIPSIYSLGSTNAAFPGGTINVEISTKSNQ